MDKYCGNVLSCDRDSGLDATASRIFTSSTPFVIEFVTDGAESLPAANMRGISFTYEQILCSDITTTTPSIPSQFGGLPCETELPCNEGEIGSCYSAAECLAKNGLATASCQGRVVLYTYW